MKTWLLVLSTCLISSLAYADSLNIRVTGVQHDEGQILVLLYQQQDFLKDQGEVARQTVSLKEPGEVQLQFNDLDPGDYAFVVVHDENSNNEMDRKMGFIPKEGWAFSTNYKPRFGPPKFKKCRFSLQGTTEQQVTLIY